MNERLNQEEIEVLLNEEAGKGAPAKEKASAPRAERRKETALPPAGDISAQVEARVPEDTTEKSGPAIEPAVFEEFSHRKEIPVAGMEVLWMYRGHGTGKTSAVKGPSEPVCRVGCGT